MWLSLSCFNQAKCHVLSNFLEYHTLNKHFMFGPSISCFRNITYSSSISSLGRASRAEYHLLLKHLKLGPSISCSREYHLLLKHLKLEPSISCSREYHLLLKHLKLEPSISCSRSITYSTGVLCFSQVSRI
jgi:hypothetical protein